MTTLITGGAGYVGSHICLEFLQTDTPVVVVDDLSTGCRDIVPTGAEFLHEDIGNLGAMEDALKRHDVSTIIHCAASTSVPESIANPLKYYENNTSKSISLIKTAVDCGVSHFIFSSTAAVYGEPEDSLISESHSTTPVSPYGMSKLMVEQVLSDIGRANDMKYAILRYFNVAGADPQGRSGQTASDASNLMKVVAEAACGLRDRFEIFGTDYDTKDGTCVRDFIHVADLASAHVDVHRYLLEGGDSTIFNCGNSEGYSVLDVVNAMKKVSGCDFQVESAERRMGDVPEVIARSDKIRSVVGWKPENEDLDSMVKSCLAWERSRAVN